MALIVLKIKIITKLLIALTALMGLLQHQQLGGAISLSTIKIPQTATSSLDIVANSLNAIPNISITGKTVSFSAIGTYDGCTVYINQYNPTTFNKGYYQDAFALFPTQTIQKTLPSGSYPVSFVCGMTGKQNGVTQSTIVIP